MTWQDAAMAVVQLLFLPTLIPMIRAPWWQKPPRLTSLSTALLLIASSCILSSTGIYFGAACQWLLGALWTVLYIQRRFGLG